MTWPWQKKPEPREAFVVCEKGAPTAVCFDETAVWAELSARDRRLTQVHQVPIKRAG